MCASINATYSDDGDAGLSSGELLMIVFSQLNNAVCDRRVQVVVAPDVFLHYVAMVNVDNTTGQVYNHKPSYIGDTGHLAWCVVEIYLSPD